MSLVTAFHAALARLQRREAREAAAKPERNAPEPPSPGAGELDEPEAFKRRWRIGATGRQGTVGG